MKKITELENVSKTKTLNFVLLSIITGGVYPLMWMFRYGKGIEKITNQKIADDLFIIILAASVGLSYVLKTQGVQSLVMVSGVMSIVSWAMYISWSFKAKTAIEKYLLSEHDMPLKLNTLYTILFTVYYINFSMNKLAEEQQ